MPIAIKDKLNRNNPKKFPKIEAIFNFAKNEITTANIKLIEIQIKKIDKAAINLPKTIKESFTGNVNKATSVFCFFSSLKILIVSIGIKKIVIMKRLLKV